VGVLTGMTMAAYLLGIRPSSKELARYNVGRLFEIVSQQQPEYLFLLGICLVAASFLIKRYWVPLVLVTLIAFAWVIYYESVSVWLLGLGADSFSETQKFDLHEALFFIPGMLSIFVPFIAYRRLALYGIAGFFIFSALLVVRRKGNFSGQTTFVFCFLAGLCLTAVALYILSVRATLSYQSNSEIFNRAAKNFDNPAMPLVFNRPLNVVIYLGESTTVMNMGLYGYPRDTTPELTRLAQQDSQVLVFKNVMSTFTHTSDSLLEALSIGLHTNQDLLPITSRTRVSLPDLLAYNHIPSYLLSNQGEEGTWNMAGSIIFKHAQKQYSVDTTRLGNAEYMINRPYDGDFFLKHLDVLIPTLSSANSSVVFLHSFAGHGGMNGYLGAIPKDFYPHVDDYFKNRSDAAIAGTVRGATENIENYDSAIRYVDRTVSQVIEKLSRLENPTVLIYFSDHGESVFTSRGHESSRFTHEMARVPLLVSFNASARLMYPDLFNNYKHLSETTALTTLAQIPATIIDLLGGQVAETALVLPRLIGAPQDAYIPPVLVRRTSSGDTYVNTNNADVHGSAAGASAPATNSADDPTRIFVAHQTHLLDQSALCYSDVNTIAMALRGAMVANCLQLDVVANSQGAVPLTVSSASVPGAAIGAVVEIASRNKLSLWLQVRDLKESRFCQQLLALVEPTLSAGQTVLVSLATEIDLSDRNVIGCVQTLKQKGVKTAYSLPSEQWLACAEARGRISSFEREACQPLYAKIDQLVLTDAFTDLSFDYQSLSVVELIVAAKTFRWNVMNVEPRQLLDLDANTFRMVGLKSRDRNALN
jgi:glucan phosphoethanolaminetransferase (alkaline phosphatase superfamily)